MKNPILTAVGLAVAAVIALAVYLTTTQTKEPQPQAMSFAEINTRAERPCNVTYRIEDVVTLTYPLKLHAPQGGAPCNCAGAVPIPGFKIVDTLTLPDRAYTRAELLSRVAPPKGYLIGMWNDPKITLLPEKRPCKDEPAKDRPDRLEPAEPNPVQG